MNVEGFGLVLVGVDYSIRCRMPTKSLHVLELIVSPLLHRSIAPLLLADAVSDGIRRFQRGFRLLSDSLCTALVPTF